MLFHEVVDLWVHFVDFSDLGSPSPGVFSKLQGFSSFSKVSPVFRWATSLFVADEALVVLHVLCSFFRREIDFVHIHGIRVLGGPGSSSVLNWQYVTVSPTSELSELYHISVKLSHFVQPLFPFLASLFLSIRESSGGHHDSELIGYSSLEGIYEDTVKINSTAHLSRFEGSGVFIKVSVKHVHVEGIDSLMGLVLDVLWDEGFFKAIT